MCILGRPSENLEDCDLFVLIFEAFSEKWAENCDWDREQRVTEFKRDRDADRPRWADTAKQKKKKKHLQVREGAERVSVQDVLISPSYCQQQAEKRHGWVTLWSSSDEWTRMHWPPASENAPIRTLYQHKLAKWCSGWWSSVDWVCYKQMPGLELELPAASPALSSSSSL